MLIGGNYVNLDVDECQASLDNCQQLCNNTWGDYLCDCTAGYSLNPDGRSCDAQPTYPENRLVVIVLQISTVAEFDESLFREAVALAISEYCDSIGVACFASNRARRLASLTKDKVVIVSVTSEGGGLNVAFYVLSGIEAKAIEQLRDFGFSVLNFQSTTTATGLITIAPFGGFTAGKIVGVVLGTLGGTGLLIVSIVAFYWVRETKRSAKVYPKLLIY
ncbi:vitellogenin receptor Yl-like isoform X2 [Oscarella lobularis]|uniref:vitellogenin receptor Yl-like isoform X2 n=1 Tax=Oscarella lobularis TaxID=121494 RepID=UPI003313555D